MSSIFKGNDGAEMNSSNNMKQTNVSVCMYVCLSACMYVCMLDCLTVNAPLFY